MIQETREMTIFNEPKELYYYEQHRLNQISTNKVHTAQALINKLLTLQATGLGILLISVGLQAVAMLTNDWYVLNVNEHVAAAKGGLWSYCYVGKADSHAFTCQYYEHIPNFAVFINQHLYTSRIFMLCGTAFLCLLILTEMIGILLLCFKSCQKVSPGTADTRLHRIQMTSTPTMQPAVAHRRQHQPHYVIHLSTALVNIVSSIMALLLDTFGFVIFNTYVNDLLKWNTIFLAFKSYSYWLMLASICLVFIYLIFKAFVVHRVASSLKHREPDQLQGKLERIPDECIQEAGETRMREYLRAPLKMSFVYDLESKADDLTTSTFSSLFETQQESHYETVRGASNASVTIMRF